MKFGLGIDTGGTYTDSVIYDFDEEQVVESGKARTRKDDLEIGINEVLDKLSSQNLKKVQIVSLSTTLATNAAVEGKMGEGTLVMIGCDRETVSRKREKYGLPPTGDIIFLDGGHNHQGDVKFEPDWEKLKQKINKYQQSTDGFAIVQKWGMRNPEFEKKAKTIIKKETGLPLVCAHELLGDLNYLKRGATALLNVRLIPIINKFMDAIKITLHQRNISAPLVMVKGDGSLMAEDYARERPLETLLSGPAASVVGGVNITGEKNSLIVDMGGTTTDLALVKSGRPRLAYGGINVGDWITGTKSIKLNTIGLGGDSAIRYDNYHNLKLGPQRVAPLTWLASEYPKIVDELKYLKNVDNPVVEFVYLSGNIEIKDYDLSSYDFSKKEQKILQALKDGPLSYQSLAKKLELSIYDLKLDKLKDNEIIASSCLTPTDIMHITGDFTRWNSEAAQIAGEILAEELDLSLNELALKIKQEIKKKIYYQVCKMLLENKDDFFQERNLGREFSKLLELSYDDYIKNQKLLNIRFETDFDLVGIGAPVHVFLPEVAEVLNTECLIPEHASVANAVGAITGNISVKEEVEIKPVYDVSGIIGYNCFSSEQKQSFDDYEKAREWAESKAREITINKAKTREAGKLRVFTETEEDLQNDVLLKTIVTARAIGTFTWL